jgi:hypothetical protein
LLLDKYAATHSSGGPQLSSQALGFIPNMNTPPTSALLLGISVVVGGIFVFKSLPYSAWEPNGKARRIIFIIAFVFSIVTIVFDPLIQNHGLRIAYKIIKNIIGAYILVEMFTVAKSVKFKMRSYFAYIGCLFIALTLLQILGNVYK